MFSQWYSTDIEPLDNWNKDLALPDHNPIIGVAIKINASSKTIAQSKPLYSRIQAFRAVAAALLAPTPELTSYAELPTKINDVNKYLDSPKINIKLVYQVHIYINCPKPFFLVMKNNSLTSWLRTQKITLTVNNLPFLMASNIGIFFFSYPRVSLVHIKEFEIKVLLDWEDAPEFRVQPWEAKSGEWKAYAIMIQSNKEDVALSNTQIEQAKTAFPYEYISWDYWQSLNSARKATFIEEHNAHIR
jgi:hypothetical protein